MENQTNQIENNIEVSDNTTEEESITQSQEQENISDENISGKNQKKSLKNKIILLIILIAAIGIGCTWYIGYYKGEFYTTEEKLNKIYAVIVSGDWNEGIKLTRRFFGYSDSANDLVDAIRAYGYDSMASYVLEHSNQSSNDIKSKVEITDKKLVHDGDYYYFTATIKNNSDETLSYVKLDIFLYDEYETLIGAEWTNWSGTLPPKGSTTVDTMIKEIEGYSNLKFSAAIDEVSIK